MQPTSLHQFIRATRQKLFDKSLKSVNNGDDNDEKDEVMMMVMRWMTVENSIKKGDEVEDVTIKRMKVLRKEKT